MSITKDVAKIELAKLINQIPDLQLYYSTYSPFIRWLVSSKVILEEVFGSQSRFFTSFNSIKWSPSEAFGYEIIFGSVEKSKKDHYIAALEVGKGILESALEYLNTNDLNICDSYDSFWNIIHPTISSVAKGRFDSEHYADSVEAALKEINTIVKNTVRNHTNQEFDGAGLMGKAFSVDAPIIKLADLSTESGKNVQKGYLQIFSGAMTGIRNPKAHENITIDKVRATHLLFLASLLMYKITDSESF